VSVESQSFTILGAGGFIGAALVAWLESQGRTVHAITRGSLQALLAARRPAGHVIDCIGMTGDFQVRPLDIAEAHVGLVARCLANLQFASFLLLSSTHVYARADTTQEDVAISLQSAEPSDLYSLTKLAGEALCLAYPRPEIRIARLSNVYGAGMSAETFLGQVLREGEGTGGVVFHQSAASAKDYVNIAALVRLLPDIAERGRSRLYNVASGRNTSHGMIADRLQQIAGWRICIAVDAPTVLHPPIDTTRLVAEFGQVACDFPADLAALLSFTREIPCSQSTRPMAA
jgi:nucleoside-diphosphate-sugar epimerase